MCSMFVKLGSRAPQAKIRVAEGQLKHASAQPGYGTTVLKVNPTHSYGVCSLANRLHGSNHRGSTDFNIA